MRDLIEDIGLVKDFKRIPKNFEQHRIYVNTEKKSQSSTTDKRLCFVLVTEPDKRLYIQFIPTNVSIQRNSSTQTVQIVGRNNPLYQYTAGEKLLSMTLDFYSEEEEREDVIKRCHWLEGLTYNDGYDKPPERVRLVWGDLYQDEIWTVKSVNYSLSNFHKGWGFLPQQAYVDITLALDVDKDVVKSDLLRHHTL